MLYTNKKHKKEKNIESRWLFLWCLKMHIFIDIKGKGKYVLAIPALAISATVHNSSRFYQIMACLSTCLYAKQTSVLEWKRLYVGQSWEA